MSWLTIFSWALSLYIHSILLEYMAWANTPCLSPLKTKASSPHSKSYRRRNTTSMHYIWLLADSSTTIPPPSPFAAFVASFYRRSDALSLWRWYHFCRNTAVGAECEEYLSDRKILPGRNAPTDSLWCAFIASNILSLYASRQNTPD